MRVGQSILLSLRDAQKAEWPVLRETKEHQQLILLVSRGNFERDYLRTTLLFICFSFFSLLFNLFTIFCQYRFCSLVNSSMLIIEIYWN